MLAAIMDGRHDGIIPFWQPAVVTTLCLHAAASVGLANKLWSVYLYAGLAVGTKISMVYINDIYHDIFKRKYHDIFNILNLY